MDPITTQGRADLGPALQQPDKQLLAPPAPMQTTPTEKTLELKVQANSNDEHKSYRHINKLKLE